MKSEISKHEVSKQGQGGSEEDPIIIRLRRTHLIMLAIAVVSFTGGFLVHGWMSGTPVALPATGGSPASESSPAEGAATTDQRLLVDTDDDAFLGPPDAPVTIIEFSDYQCPYCKRFRDDTLERLMAAYDGQVRFVYRDFPLSDIHPAAQKAAEASECAEEQGQFWKMHDRLFEEQTNWAEAQDPSMKFREYAGDLDMDVDEFADCLSSSKYAGEVQNDFNDGLYIGINGTPTFFVNGIPLSGAQPFSAFEAVIDRELATSVQ